MARTSYVAFPFDPQLSPIREARIKAPQDMIAFGDVCVDPTSAIRHPYSFLNVAFYVALYDSPSSPPEPKRLWRESEARRHGGVHNLTFADGHAEHGKPARFFKDSDDMFRRWNNDNKPHR
jgi:prepilin-type processing-associated H-X9-DG protein